MRRSSDLDNIGLSCRLNRLNKHSRWDKWQDKVSFCSLIRFNWRVPARVPLFSLGLKAHRSGPFGHSGRLSEVLLTHYRRREVRKSIYRYREIHIDYRSKFSYRFISFISIIYGNTNWFRWWLRCWLPNRWKAVIWTNDSLVYWWIYSSFGLSELIVHSSWHFIFPYHQQHSIFMYFHALSKCKSYEWFSHVFRRVPENIYEIVL